MKTADLVAGPQTDALVALALGWVWHVADNTNPHDSGSYWVDSKNQESHIEYAPSTNPAQWAELQLIFRVRTAPMYQDGDLIYWTAGTHACLWDATTLGLDICKAVIAAKFGDEIPTEIWEEVK